MWTPAVQGAPAHDARRGRELQDTSFQVAGPQEGRRRLTVISRGGPFGPRHFGVPRQPRDVWFLQRHGDEKNGRGEDRSWGWRAGRRGPGAGVRIRVQGEAAGPRRGDLSVGGATPRPRAAIYKGLAVQLGPVAPREECPGAGLGSVGRSPVPQGRGRPCYQPGSRPSVCRPVTLGPRSASWTRGAGPSGQGCPPAPALCTPGQADPCLPRCQQATLAPLSQAAHLVGQAQGRGLFLAEPVASRTWRPRPGAAAASPRAPRRPETPRGPGRAGRRAGGALGSIPSPLSHDAPVIWAPLLGTPTPHSCRASQLLLPPPGPRRSLGPGSGRLSHGGMGPRGGGPRNLKRKQPWPENLENVPKC